MVSVGSTVPAPPKSLWEKSDGNTVSFPTSGKYIILGVPGAFTRLSLPSLVSVFPIMINSLRQFGCNCSSLFFPDPWIPLQLQ